MLSGQSRRAPSCAEFRGPVARAQCSRKRRLYFELYTASACLGASSKTASPVVLYEIGEDDRVFLGEHLHAFVERT